MSDQTPYTPTIEQFLGFANSALIASGMPEKEAFRITERVLAAHDAQVRAETLREAAAWKREHNLGHSVWGDYLKQLAEQKYQAGGDDMIPIWLNDRADRIEQGENDD